MPDLSFRAMLKPLDVEEVIDVALHRPLAYVITRAAYPTPVTPDQITWVSMFVGIAAGAAAWSSFASGLHAWGSRGRSSSSRRSSTAPTASSRGCAGRAPPFGRMLDGAVDAVVQLAVVPAMIAHVWWRVGGPSPAALPRAAPWRRCPRRCGSRWAWARRPRAPSTPTLYDHYKNIYLHHTQPVRGEGDDPEEDLAAWDARGDANVSRRLAALHRRAALPHPAVRAARLARPARPARFRDMPEYSLERAARFRILHRGLMRAWTFYGIGTHIFGLAPSR